MENNIMYAYIKGSRYKNYSVNFNGNEVLKEVKQEFDTFDELMEFIMNFSNYYSVAIQFYM